MILELDAFIEMFFSILKCSSAFGALARVKITPQNALLLDCFAHRLPSLEVPFSCLQRKEPPADILVVWKLIPSVSWN